MTCIAEMDLVTSRLTELTDAINDLRETMLTNLDDTRAIRDILDKCPICDLNEGTVIGH